MNTIDSVKIENLWGSNTLIEFNCDRKFNFIIGENGTGKTTVINLISAALTGDFEQLDKTEFDRITIILKPIAGRKKPSIEVCKEKKNGIQNNEIKYKFKLSQNQKDEPIQFTLTYIDQDRLPMGLLGQNFRDKFFHDSFSSIKKELQSLVKISWLSIHRFNVDIRMREDRERKIIPAIDQKLSLLTDDLLRYFSSLSKKYSDSITEFQKKTLLSVLTPEKTHALIERTKTIDIEKEKKALAGIFDVLKVDEKQYSPKIKNHFDKFDQTIKDIAKKDSETFTTAQFATVYDTWRTHNLAQEYEQLQEEKTRIFELRDNFFNEINLLLKGRKQMLLSEKNELYFETQNKNKILVHELSSGEKQLLIILGETLLQQEKSIIYIADEPELSLHISWQEVITSSISKLNPNAQIIFATHSPDIVSRYSDKIIDMEAVVK